MPRKLVLRSGRVRKVNADPGRWIEVLDRRRKKPFGGPSEYFHRRAISRLGLIGLRRALTDERFLEYVYATLAAWGLHRMGNTKAKLIDFDMFQRELARRRREILALGGKTIFDAATDESVVGDLAALATTLKVGVGNKRLVYSSKALHHLLPRLLPPIDNQYTLRFFYGRTQVSNPDRRFKAIYHGFIDIAKGNRPVLERWASKGTGFHTSITKEIDNAIVGYVLKHYPSSKRVRR